MNEQERNDLKEKLKDLLGNDYRKRISDHSGLSEMTITRWFNGNSTNVKVEEAIIQVVSERNRDRQKLREFIGESLTD